MKDFRQLRVWEASHLFVMEIYRLTEKFPREELYGLTSQIRRAAVSIPSNLAEGLGRDSQPELLRFTRIAMGSASELEYELLLAHDLHWMAEDDYHKISADLISIRKMLNSLIQTLKSNLQNPKSKI